MAQLTTDKITEIYCIAYDFCKEFSKEIKKRQILPDDDGKRHRNRSFAMSDAEIITVMIPKCPLGELYVCAARIF